MKAKCKKFPGPLHTICLTEYLAVFPPPLSICKEEGKSNLVPNAMSTSVGRPGKHPDKRGRNGRTSLFADIFHRLSTVLHILQSLSL
jgi:hypothetical protein